jgi:hypothetical protein
MITTSVTIGGNTDVTECFTIGKGYWKMMLGEYDGMDYCLVILRCVGACRLN